MIKMMYKVTILCTGKIALFEGEADAKKYVEMMEKNDHKVSLNKWTWKTEIED
jgi:hypothetical protein